MSLFENSPELLFLCGFLVFYILMHWLESKTENNFLSNFIGSFDVHDSDLFTSDHDRYERSKRSVENQQQTIEELKQRIIVLEKIVTDSRYDLDQKLNQL